MTAYSPIHKLYASDGTTLDETYFTGGILPLAKNPTYTLSAYGGCIGGKLQVLMVNSGSVAIAAAQTALDGTAAALAEAQGAEPPDPEAVADALAACDAAEAALKAALTPVAAVRQPFAITAGQIVKSFLLAGDTTPCWTGRVEQITREVGNKFHEVTLRGLWDLVEIEVDADVTLGSQATGTVSVGGSTVACNTFDTCGKIAKFLCDKWIVPAGVGISYTAGDIVCTVPRALMRIRAGTSIKRLFAELALMGEAGNLDVNGLVIAAPTRIAYGVDGAGAFFFRAIPGTILNTTTFGTSLIRGGRERPAGTGAVQQVVVMGSRAAVNGVQAKRVYRYAGATGRVKSKTIAVRSPYEADLARAAAGWQSRYSAPPVGVEGVVEVQAAPTGIPLPWMGMLRWSDPDRAGGALTIDSYFSAVTVTLGRSLTIEAEIGIGGGEESEIGSDDPYAPDLDIALEGSEADVALDASEEAAEASLGIVGDPDYEVGVDPPADEPATVSTEDAEALAAADLGQMEEDIAAAKEDIGTYEGAADLSTDLGELAADLAALDARVEDLEAAPASVTYTGMVFFGPSFD